MNAPVRLPTGARPVGEQVLTHDEQRLLVVAALIGLDRHDAGADVGIAPCVAWSLRQKLARELCRLHP